MTSVNVDYLNELGSTLEDQDVDDLKSVSTTIDEIRELAESGVRLPFRVTVELLIILDSLQVIIDDMVEEEDRDYVEYDGGWGSEEYEDEDESD